MGALIWKGTHASNVVNVQRGNVQVAPFGGETAAILTLRVGYITSVAGDSTVLTGAGVTLTTIDQTGGTLTTNSAATTVTVESGTATFNSGAHTTVNVEKDGTVYYTSTGTITTANLFGDGELNFNRNMGARTITNINIYGADWVWVDDNGTVTDTNGYDFEVGFGVQDGTFRIGRGYTLTKTGL